jgi:hypothetical protein
MPAIASLEDLKAAQKELLAAKDLDELKRVFKRWRRIGWKNICKLWLENKGGPRKMKFNEALQKRMMENARKVFARTWKIILFDGQGFVLGESDKFKVYSEWSCWDLLSLKAKPISIPISRTGTISYTIMAESNDSFPETIRDYSKLIGRMNKNGKTIDEILKRILKTRERYEIILSAGLSGCDLNVQNIYLLAGNTLTVDTFNLTV